MLYHTILYDVNHNTYICQYNVLNRVSCTTTNTRTQATEHPKDTKLVRPLDSSWKKVVRVVETCKYIYIYIYIYREREI